MTPRQWHDRAVARSALVTLGLFGFVIGGAARITSLLAMAVVCVALFILTTPPKDEP